MRPKSKIHEQWWVTPRWTKILEAHATVRDIEALERPASACEFMIRGKHFCGRALEYVKAWKQSHLVESVGVCGPIGPTEQLPIVVREMVNDSTCR